jgi:RND family efflux transporter MFP subunit
MKTWIGVGVVGIALLTLIGWRVNSEKQGSAALQQQSAGRRNQTPAVEIAYVASRPIQETLETIGTVESPQVVRLAPRFTARISSLSLREGDVVRAGQVLAVLDPQELGAEVAQQRASAIEARSRLAEAELRANANDTGVEAEVRRQRAELASAQADLNRAQRNYDAEVAAAEAAVDDARARVNAAKAAVANAQAELRAARAQQANAEAKLRRDESLFSKGYISEQQLENSRTAVAAAKADVEVNQAEVEAANENVSSANAQLSAAAKRVTIAKQTGQAGIAAAKANVEQARAALDQAIANRSQAPAYRQNLRALRANVEAAEAQVSAAGERLSDTQLVSPIDGTITARNGDPGSLATPATPVLVVESIDWLYVRASIASDQAGRVQKGMLAELRLDAYPNETFRGRVDKVNLAADPQSRQFTVMIRVKNPERKIRPGMFARVNIVVAEKEADAVVPIEAIKEVEGRPTVTVLNEDDEAEIRPVEVGNADAKGTEIKSGLKPGERIVVLSYQPVRAEQKVRVSSIRGADGKSRPTPKPEANATGQGREGRP